MFPSIPDLKKLHIVFYMDPEKTEKIPMGIFHEK